MQTENKLSARIKNALGNIFKKNVVITIISVIFALLLWGYVLMDTKPPRVKTVEDIIVSFDGEADLLARNLVVRGDREEILKTVSARISTELTSYADLDASDVRATISLRNISKAGDYTVTINATSTVGTTLSVNPNTVQLSIDDLVSRRIPVELIYDRAALKDGYWAGEPSINRSEIEISGAYETLEAINKAVCVLDLSERSESIHESIALKLLTQDGEEAPSSAIISTLPSVTVDMDIYRAVTLPIKVDDVILGADSLPANYEIIAKNVTPAQIVVTGPDELLDAYTELDIDSIDVSGRTSSLLTDLAINVPEGLKILGDSTVSAYVNIREMQRTLMFPQMPVEVRGLGRQLTAALQLEFADISVTGPASIINKLERGDIYMYVDAADLTAGTYILSVRIAAKNASLLEKLFVELSFNEVTVNIS